MLWINRGISGCQDVGTKQTFVPAYMVSKGLNIPSNRGSSGL